MKTILSILLLSVVLYSCTKSVEKPALTIGQYSKQVSQINEVTNKLMSEPDAKVMNFMADGVEATRAIGCDAVGEECNAYYEFINKVVDVTKDGELSKEDRELLIQKKIKLQEELKKSDIKIQNDWKNYINAEKRKD